MSKSMNLRDLRTKMLNVLTDLAESGCSVTLKMDEERGCVVFTIKEPVPVELFGKLCEAEFGGEQ